jgi:Ca2+-binding EF-hand superfamily protein
MNKLHLKIPVLIVVLIIFTSAITTSLYSAERHPSHNQRSPHDFFLAADQDHNGSLSQEEFNAMPGLHKRNNSDEQFKMIDKNGDGELQEEELVKMHEEHEAKRLEQFHHADINSDGKLSFEEFQNMHQEHMPKLEHLPFEEMDSNKDGLIQLSELPQPGSMAHTPPPPDMNMGNTDHFEDAPPPPPMDKDRPDMKEMDSDLPPPPPMDKRGQDFKAGNPDMPPPPHETKGNDSQHKRLNLEEWFRGCDLDGNGALDITELRNNAEVMQRKHFSEMDSDHDGYLQFEELRPLRGPRMDAQSYNRDRKDSEVGNLDDSDIELATMEKTGSAETVAAFKLNDNYPNPFNASTVISYQIPASSHVLLTVYNLAGEEVTTLVDENQSAGQYSIRVTMPDLTSGIYFYRLQAGPFTAVNRMAYIK